MDYWREPTAEEIQIVWRDETRANRFLILALSALIVVMVLFGWPCVVDRYREGDWSALIAFAVASPFCIGIWVFVLVALLRFLHAVRRGNFTVVTGTCAKKWMKKKFNSQSQPMLQVMYEEPSSYNVGTSEASFKRVEIGSSVFIACHQKKNMITKGGMWAYLCEPESDKE